MLSALLHKYGMTAGTVASTIDVSDTAVRNWIAGQTPSGPNAIGIARLFSPKDGVALLRHWGHDTVADSWHEVAANTTHDPNVANGWRLDTLIAEQRQTNKILNRIEQHLAPKAVNVYTENVNYHDTEESNE